jgi:hypothetical protein
MPKMHSSIWIAIVNYRTAKLVIDCLHSLSAQINELVNVRVIVADNNSGDDSVARLMHTITHEGWSSWVEVMPLQKNGGFAFGNNAIIRNALSSTEPVDYIMLLNPDTVALPGSLRILVDFMDAHPDVGISGSQLKNADGSVEYSAHAFHTPLSELDGGARLGLLSRFLRRKMPLPTTRDIAHPCDWVSGASMIIRRKVFKDIGLMDDQYFLYFEEVDFCRRAQQAGWQCWYVPTSTVIHLEGASTGISATEKRRAGYWYDSRRRYFIKHHGVAGLVAADLLWALGRSSYMLRRYLHLGAKQNLNCDPKWFLFDLLWGDLKALLTGRAWGIQHSGKQT